MLAAMRQSLFVSLFVLMLCGSGAASAAIYKWVDEHGVTHYSDQPHPGAERIDLPTAQTYEAPKAPARGAAERDAQPAATGKSSAAKAIYGHCGIASPQHDEVLVNVDAMTASVALEPPLRPGDVVTIRLDGRIVQGPGPSTQATISPIHRGTHTLTAQVQDADGRTLCRTASRSFHVRQPSLLQPSRRPQSAPTPRPPRPPSPPQAPGPS